MRWWGQGVCVGVWGLQRAVCTAVDTCPHDGHVFTASLCCWGPTSFGCFGVFQILQNSQTQEVLRYIKALLLISLFLLILIKMLPLRRIGSFLSRSLCFWSNCLVNWGLNLISSPCMTCTILSLLSHLSVMPKSKVRLQGLHSVAVAASTNKLTVATCCSLKRFIELPLRLEAKQAGYVWIKSWNQDLTMTFQMPNSWAPRLAKSVFCC